MRAKHESWIGGAPDLGYQVRSTLELLASFRLEHGFDGRHASLARLAIRATF